MSNSTMEERLRDWHRKREAKIVELKKQLEELETRELVFHPQTLRNTAPSTSAKSTASVAASQANVTSRDDVQHFLARQEAARRRKADASVNETTPKYTGLPTIPKSPAFRTEQRAVMRNSATPGSPRGASTLIPGPLVGLPPGTYAQAPPGMIFTPMSAGTVAQPYAGTHNAPTGVSPRSGRGNNNIQTIPLHTVVADLAPTFAYPSAYMSPNGSFQPTQGSTDAANGRSLAVLDAAVREEQAAARHERALARQSGLRSVPSGPAPVTIVVTPASAKTGGAVQGSMAGLPVTLEALSLRDLYANPAIIGLVSPNGAPSRQ